VRSLQRAPFKYEGELLELLELLGAMSLRFADKLGPLARRLEALDQPLAASLSALQHGAQHKP
jgi:hypothetical protein